METNNNGQGRSSQDGQNVSGRSNENWSADGQLDREAGDGGLGSDSVQASGQSQSGYDDEIQGGLDDSSIGREIDETSTTDGMNSGQSNEGQETQGGASHGGQPQEFGESNEEIDESVQAGGRQDFNRQDGGGSSTNQASTPANGGSVRGKVLSDL